MTARAEVRTDVTGTDVGVRKLSDLESSLQRLGATTQKTSAYLKQARELWNDPVGAKGKWDWSERLGASVARASVDIIKGQVGAAADAVVAPAKTSYAGAIAVANQYRDTTQRIATSTGLQYSEIGKQVTGASQRLGLLPGQVQNYSRGVRSLTGDRRGAMSGREGDQNRALATDRTIEEMIPTAAHLAQTFGSKSTQDVNKFFGTIDAQAKQANVSTQVLENTVVGMAGSFARLTGAAPQVLSGLAAQVMGGAPNREMGEERLGYASSFLNSHSRYFERRARSAGVLKKGESLYDSQGRIRSDKFADMIEVAQKDAARHYGTNNPQEIAGRAYESGGAPSVSAMLGFLRINTAALRKQQRAGGQASDSAALADFMATDAGRRTQYDAQKQSRDINLGMGMLGAQDTAVSMGGGAGGIALASAGQLFEKSTAVFWDAVNIFAGKGGGGGSSATGAAVGTTVATAGRTALSWGGKLISRLGMPGLVAGALTMEGDKAPGSGGETVEDLKAEQAERKKRGGGHYSFGYSDAELQEKIAAGGQQSGGSASATAQADAIGAAVAKHLEGKTLRTQNMTPAQPPAGMSQPL